MPCPCMGMHSTKVGARRAVPCSAVLQDATSRPPAGALAGPDVDIQASFLWLMAPDGNRILASRVSA